MFRRNYFEARIPAFNASLYLRPIDRKEVQRKCRESAFLTKVKEVLLNEENISNDYSIGIAWKPQSWDTQEKVDLNLEICFLPLPQQTKEFWGEITATEKSHMYRNRMQSKQMAGNGKMGLARPRDFDMCCCICLFTCLCCLEFPSRKSAASSSVQVGP